MSGTLKVRLAEWDFVQFWVSKNARVHGNPQGQRSQTARKGRTQDRILLRPNIDQTNPCKVGAIHTGHKKPLIVVTVLPSNNNDTSCAINYCIGTHYAI